MFDDKKTIVDAIVASQGAWNILIGELIDQMAFDPHKLGKHLRGVQADLHKTGRPDMAVALDVYTAIADTWSQKTSPSD
ncbi:hypothetical protein [Serratia sp. JSRIV004]|uniref:hypothetical protein n=1 Tax=Serratia sp. JSRIV004 TaxID=2831895 RepID=UPI001CBAAB62|nr:hypothetical protein [Serratia sp. JSRIV004]UAN55469.1 hypothetical protein KGP21_17390 [Serratia sp. JSRIV004]UAN57282.1 hypothetical protein KGP21_27415 [Serratia sp. JSRIV004]